MPKLYLNKNYNVVFFLIKISNVAIFQVSVALTINFSRKKGFRKLTFAENVNSKGSRPSSEVNFVYPDNTSRNMFRLNYEIK